MTQDGAVQVREWLDYATARVPLMQIDEIKRTRNIGLGIAFVEGEEKTPAEVKNVQRPRVFYRREGETQQLIIAKP